MSELNGNRKFTMLDENFTCAVCGAEVRKLEYTARNHCPQCLCSLHVDINPGDRACTCKGVLQPIGIEKFKDTYKVIHKCSKCGQVKRNIIANDDNMDLIIKLSANAVKY